MSVVMPVYDRTQELREAIESVRSQTYPHWELIIVTDGSPRSTMEVVDSYRTDPRVRIFSYSDQSGTAVRGRNRGIKQARGEYVAFLDSDDIAEPWRLAVSVREMERTDCDVVYGAWTAKLDGSRSIDGLRDGQVVHSPECDLEMLERICVPCQSTVMVRRAALIDVGGLRPEMRYREDHELWMRLAYFGYRFRSVRESLTRLRLHAQNNELNFKAEDAHWKRMAQDLHVSKPALPLTIAYLIPGTAISGGISVILEHANRLHLAGHDVIIISEDDAESIPWWPGNRVPVIPANTPHRYALEAIDTLVATAWSTVSMLDHIAAGRKVYFVQSDERRFRDRSRYKRRVERTYLRHDVEHVTMARWIGDWLKKEFGHDVEYVPNGIDVRRFQDAVPLEPKGSRVRILLEGQITQPFKGMADAAKAVESLDDCEIWIVSSAGRPPAHWRCDRFFEAVPPHDMAAIYASCDILLKMSRVESFCYPPLEMMATGGAVVVRQVTGIEEYAIDGVNCLIVSSVESAAMALRRLVADVDLRQRLGAAGRLTAAGRGWEVSEHELLRVLGRRTGSRQQAAMGTKSRLEKVTGPLIIAGMHRSGTSLAASTLARAGLNVGSRLIGALKGNDRGHWEDLDFYEFHATVLRLSRLDPDGLSSVGDVTVPYSMRRAARRLAVTKSRAGALWGWKDPRTTLFLDFWANLLRDSYFLLMFRSPWAVVDSLFRRGDPTFAEQPVLAVSTWHQYNRRVLRFARQNESRCLVCDVEQVASDPPALVAAVRLKFGLPLTDAPSPYEPGLLARDSTVRGRAIIGALMPESLLLYHALRALAGLPEPDPSLEAPMSLGEAERAIREWQHAAAERG